MKNPLKSAGSQNFGLFLARLPIGVLFLWVGFQKLHETGLHQFVSQHAGQVPSWVSISICVAVIAGIVDPAGAGRNPERYPSQRNPT